MRSHYIVGIDLGTTNSVIAYSDMEDEQGKITILPLAQLIKAGMVEDRLLLPSFLYLPPKHELGQGNFDLPWSQGQDYCVGEFARKQGSYVPDRLVTSAKSWLCHRGVDRKSQLLPFSAAVDVPKISPIEASARYLSHIKNYWNFTLGRKPETSLENQTIYLTVPASFDAVARELTVVAATKAGLQVTLLEEPQSAFYAWIYHHQQKWRQILHTGDVILVVDVGGGTTDLSLVSVSEENGNLMLRRDAVGDHILLGGDNMDVAMAHVVSHKLPKVSLDAWQSVSLWHTCREAKEKILSNDTLDKVPIAILGRGSSVIGGSLKAELTRQELEQTLIEGFFPKIKIDDTGGERRKIGLAQMGLPYASEPAITRHIARFLQQNRRDEKNLFAAPTAILFNGGVFKATKFKDRICEVINSWLAEAGKPAMRILEGDDLDLAVAIGAAYYGQVQLGKGVRIRGGTARSYYLGIETTMPAVPGVEPPMKALCVVPHGMEEGTELDIPDTQLWLTIGEPVEFPFFSSGKHKKILPGQMLDVVEENLEKNASLQTALNPMENIASGETIPVKLHSKVSEIGTLEISCRTVDTGQSWNLQFNIREINSN